MSATAIKIGVISDTHSLLRPEAITALTGSSHIIHAGDICSPEILTHLREIAPVTAVRGNNDKGDWARSLALDDLVQIAGRTFYVIHDLAELAIDPARAGIDVVISGHSHSPKIETRNGVIYINPGSAGPRRFTLPIALAELWIKPEGVEARIIELTGHS
jgi:uncharacterized protein